MKSDWRQKLLVNCGPGMLAGIAQETWAALRAANQIDTPYRMRGALISAGSYVNSALGWLEETTVQAKVAAVQIREPVLIIGHWRSGTTHLHQMLTRDEQFCFPSVFQVFFPHTCLRAAQVLPRVLGPFYRGKRTSDNLERDLQSPGEDEFAACIGSGKSPFLGFVFPRNQARYDEYLTFRSAPPAELAQWQGSLTTFLKKITWRYGKPLVLKSPTHTARIRVLLEMFPDARFIHIHRHPYEVLQSTIHLDRVSLKSFALQRPPEDRIPWIVRRYREMYDAFLEEKHLIAPDRFFEVAYEDLVKDPIMKMQEIYAHLGIAGFSRFRPVLEQYLASLTNFKKNEHKPLPTDLCGEVRRSWARCFEEWKYCA
jgi:hypothetical protein